LISGVLVIGVAVIIYLIHKSRKDVVEPARGRRCE